MSDQVYWNPVLETLPREKLQNLQLHKFRRIFKWTYENSKFHNALYKAAGIEPGDISSFEDIKNIRERI